jgi:hypothetical protein
LDLQPVSSLALELVCPQSALFETPDAGLDHLVMRVRRILMSFERVAVAK